MKHLESSSNFFRLSLTIKNNLYQIKISIFIHKFLLFNLILLDCCLYEDKLNSDLFLTLFLTEQANSYAVWYFFKIEEGYEIFRTGLRFLDETEILN